MAKAIYNGVDNVARQVKQPYIGVDNVSRKVTDGYIGVDNVARQCFSSGATWGKYNCVESPKYYFEKTYLEDREYTYEFYFYMYNTYAFWCDYEFSSSEGFYWTAEVHPYLYITPDTTLSDIENHVTNGYSYDSMHSTSEEIYRVTSILSFDKTDDYIVVTLKSVLVDLAESWFIGYSYNKGNTSYGTITVDGEGLPEEGTLIEGSFDEGYCVLDIGGTYYYYVLED